MDSLNHKNEKLHEILDILKRASHGDDYYINKIQGNQDIVKSLNPKLELREYQLEAIGRFIFYSEEYRQAKKPNHILFNLATGSGKTLIMAATMLYLYKKGYRNFIFFTHLTNIIDKTKDNFLNPQSSKYLFAKEISLDGTKVAVREVDNFNGCSDQDINMMFTTINGLHNQWQNSKENALSRDDLEGQKIVLLGDEAHHFSAGTKKPGKEQEEENLNWEYTILADLVSDMGNNNPGLLHVNPKKDNILLEFTATIAWDNLNIVQKYEDKVIFRYDLLEFRKDLYSKNVSTLQFDAPPFERALSAMVLSQYRLKVSQENNIGPSNIKPVVLFKSNQVNQPKDKSKTEGTSPKIVVSNDFKEMFHDRLSKLKSNDLKKIREQTKSSDVIDGLQGSININKAFEFFDNLGISMDNLTKEIQRDFAIENCISVDTVSDTRDKQILLNSLEDKNNNIRAVFATEKLNEGWDVLNLFDIVRLYDTRDSRNNKAGKTTIQEAQLIGRGARYCPFVVGEYKDLYKRKFDKDLGNPLSILERLHYHSTSNPKYIQELEQVLIDEGIIDKEKKTKIVGPKNNLKNIPITSKETIPWRKGGIFLNKREDFQAREITDVISEVADEYKKEQLIIKLFNMRFREKVLKDPYGEYLSVSSSTSNAKLKVFLSELGIHVIRTAMGYYPSANLYNLVKIIDNIKSINSFIDILGARLGANILVDCRQNSVDKLSQEEKLYIAKKFIEKLLEILSRKKTEYRGSKEFIAHSLGTIFGKDKERQIIEKEGNSNYSEDDVKDLISNDWFAQTDFPGATDQEVAFLDFIKDKIGDIEERYDYFMVFRNDNHFGIYNFDDGARFNPDFLLVFKKKRSKRLLSHQVFIEPKGPQFIAADETFKSGNQGWKEDFLKRIEKEAKVVAANKDIKLIGMPFFHKDFSSQKGSMKRREEFENSFENKLLKDATPASSKKKKTAKN